MTLLGGDVAAHVYGLCTPPMPAGCLHENAAIAVGAASISFLLRSQRRQDLTSVYKIEPTLAIFISRPAISYSAGTGESTVRGSTV